MARLRRWWWVDLTLGVALGATFVVGCSSERNVESTAEVSERLTSTLSIPLPPGVPISALTLGANGSLKLNDRARTIEGTLSGAVANLGATDTRLTAQAKTGNLWSQASVTLLSGARVEGDLRTHGILVNQGGTVTGSSVLHAVLTPVDSVQWTVTLPATNKGPVTLAPGSQRTLAPDSYGKLSVGAGATLRLSSGTYFFTDFAVEPGGVLSITTTNGPVVLYARTTLNYKGIVQDLQGKGDILLGYLGTAATVLEAPFKGTLVAPNAMVTLAAGTHTGAFFAKQLELRADASVVHKGFSALPPTGCTGAPDGTTCNDKNACTNADSCKKGVCTGASSVVCAQPSNPCLKAFCDPADGTCPVRQANGDVCNDGNPATTGELCFGGQCVPPPTSTTEVCTTQSGVVKTIKANPNSRLPWQNAEQNLLLYLKQRYFKPESLAFTTVVPIPVVFHVLENPAVPHVEDSDLLTLLARLNTAYQQLVPGIRSEFAEVAATTPFAFELAARSPTCGATTGIERVATSVAAFDDAGGSCPFRPFADPAKGGVVGWDPNQYLNIWVAQLTNTFVRGSATFPGVAGPECDGFVLPPAELTKTEALGAIHEFGHFFDLEHTETPNDFGPTMPICAGASPDNCGTEGDAICDTPSTSDSSNNCLTTLNTCVDSPFDAHDQIENYMYSTLIFCRTMFTAQQVLRMEGTLATARAGLLASEGAIPPPSNPAGDLWSRDGQGDVGQEPNAVEVVWASDDIWVRNDEDGQQQHEDPIYRPGQPNHVFVRVRNRGCAMAEGNTITLRWAKASTNLGYPAPWDGSQTVPGGTAPMGSLIGTKTIGALGPGASTIVEFDWEPPNPADYASFGADQTHFCLLSQIGTVPTASQDLATLVRSSNDAVWKNVSVAADSTALDVAGMMQGDGPGNPQQLSFSDPALPGAPGSIFQWGAVQVDLGSLLAARWVAGGSQASGTVSVSGTKVTFTGPVTLKHILLQANERAVFHARFLPYITVEAPSRSIVDVYRLDATQLTEAVSPPRVLGGLRFLIKTARPLPSSGE